jgi:hypothetical protein
MAEQKIGTPLEPIRFDEPASPPSAGGTPAAPPVGAMTCAKCSTSIGAYYYEAGGAIYCARCKRTVEESAATGSGGMGRGALYGLGAALLGAFGYWAFIKITDLDWALISVGVAVFVAQAIRKGNGGRSGRRFQVLAVALTYFAIGAAYAPFMIGGMMEASKSQASAAQGDSTALAAAPTIAPADSATDESEAEEIAATRAEAPASSDDAPISPGKAVVIAIGAVLLVALAGPVLSIAGGGFPGALINLAIVGFALVRAWQMTGVEGAEAGGQLFTGPYKVGAPQGQV